MGWCPSGKNANLEKFCVQVVLELFKKKDCLTENIKVSEKQSIFQKHMNAELFVPKN